MDPRERAVLLQSGFMRAGKLLVDSALADPLLRLELTLPALYAYRHAIEPGLKWTLVTNRQAFDVDCPDMHASHSLKTSWTSSSSCSMRSPILARKRAAAPRGAW